MTVIFPTRADAEREHGPLRGAGVLVLYYDEQGERAVLGP